MMSMMELIKYIQMTQTDENPLMYQACIEAEYYGEYSFTVSGKDLGGNFGFSSKLILLEALVQNSEQISTIPKKFSLLPNYPNPFNPGTWIPYELPESSDITIEIYSLDGRLIRSLKIGQQSPGSYTSMNKAAYWDGKDDSSQEVASGVYFYSLKSDKFKDIRKMILLK